MSYNIRLKWAYINVKVMTIEAKTMKGMLLVLVNIAAATICLEGTCKICDNILHGQKSTKKALQLRAFCTAVFDCCTANNLLDPINQLDPIIPEEVFEPPIDPAIALYPWAFHARWIFLLVLALCSGIISVIISTIISSRERIF